MRTLTQITVIAVLFAIVALTGIRYGRKTAKKPVELIVVWDTTEVVTHDTIVRYRPIYRYSETVRHDTIRFTTIEHDTVTVDVPIERRVYEEDSLYRAVVTGFRPSLESLTIWPKTTTITITKTVPVPDRRKWGIGLQAGYGAGKNGLTPYVGVGVGYDLLSW